jgi:hypothetical protein
MSNENIQQAEVQSLTQDANLLETQIKQLEMKVMALTTEADEKRKAAQAAFREKHAKIFVDINPAMALSGHDAQHAINLFSISYIIRPPKGEDTRNVSLFVMDPNDKANNIDYGPVTQDEATLLRWLSKIIATSDKGNKQEKDLASIEIPKRLKFIRGLAEPIPSKLAARCLDLEIYLGVVMELELGNSSPTR